MNDERVNPSDLPSLCFHAILSSLDSPRDLFTCMFVSREWLSVASSSSLWQEHAQVSEDEVVIELGL
jgi:hypothetical protein